MNERFGERLGEARRLLLADDDPAYCEVLADALRRRRFAVRIAHSVPEALAVAEKTAPSFAVIDLIMPGGSGLEVVAGLCARDPEVKVVVLTGYASIATAVEAIKLGATQYLTKPADADEIVAAFGPDATRSSLRPPQHSRSMERVEHEHIRRVLSEAGGNVSETARRLGMHRRSLQRKLKNRL